MWSERCSNLVANIFVVTMTASGSNKHSYWTSEDVRSTGNMYLGWLYHIRHRGTLSSIAPDFERFVNMTASVVASTESDRTLRQEWLEVRSHSIVLSHRWHDLI